MQASTESGSIAPASIRLFREPAWVLNISAGGQCHSGIVVVRAAPLTYPDRLYLLPGRKGL
jgi:hypothetical protein